VRHGRQYNETVTLLLAIFMLVGEKKLQHAATDAAW